MIVRNTITGMLILFAATACSMEEDLMDNATGPQAEGTGIFASFAIHVNEQQAITRAGESNWGLTPETDNTVHTGSLILLNDNADKTVFQVWDNLTVDGTTVGTGKLQLKLPKGTGSKKVYALFVANTAQSFAGSANLEDINTKMLTNDDLQKSVKVSDLESTILVGYPTLDAATQATASSLAFTVRQLTASILLKEFNVAFRGGTIPADVYVENLRLTKVNTQSNLLDNATPVLSPSPVLWKNGNEFQVWNAANEAVGFGTPSFRSFTNVDATNAIQLAFTINYGSRTQDFSFIINRSGEDTADFNNNLSDPGKHIYIKAGYEYQIKINATLTGDHVSLSVVCYTLDWKDGGEHEVVWNQR